MGSRKIVVKESAAKNIAAISLHIESFGFIATAEKFSDEVYDYFLKMGDTVREYALCRDPGKAVLGYKCVPYKKKYIIVFIETSTELIICEFLPAKLVYW